MKNVDIPLWDKGDSTDNFAKGGGKSALKFDQMVKQDQEIVDIFELVLGRKPTTRESAYYRISRLEREEIIEKLIQSPEHRELVIMASKYPALNKDNKKLESTVLKLKSNIEDSEKEYEELKKLLQEKNLLINQLRDLKDQPYLTNKKLIEESNNYYSKFQEREMYNNKSISYSDKSLWDKILELFFNK